MESFNIIMPFIAIAADIKDLATMLKSQNVTYNNNFQRMQFLAHDLLQFELRNKVVVI